MAEVRHVHADLVRASGFEAALEQRGVERSVPERGSGCAPACRPAHDRHARALHRMPANGGVDRAARRQAAAHQRQILALHACAPAAGAPGRSAPPASWPPPAGRWCPCRGDARCRRAATAPSCGRMMQQRVEHRALQLPLPGCTTSPAGLSITMHVRRLRRRWRARSPPRAAPFGRSHGRGELRRVSPPHTFCRGLGGGAVYRHPARSNPALQAVARIFRQQLRQSLVQAQPATFAAGTPSAPRRECAIVCAIIRAVFAIGAGSSWDFHGA